MSPLRSPAATICSALCQWSSPVQASPDKERHRVRVEGMAASLALTWSPAGWLVYTENAVTRVEPATARTKEFPLPGTLLDG